MSYEYFESLDNKSAERYKQKLSILGLACCPFKLPADKWKDDVTEWPSLLYHDLYHYLIKSPRIFSPEAMENYKSLEAYKYFASGWVQAIFHIWLDNGYFLAKAEVRPSYRTNDTHHQPWVALNKKGSVLCAHCTCMAGLGETCSHVAGVLYKIEAAVRLGFTKQTPTDLPCEWNQNFTKNVTPSRIADIDFYSPEAKKKITNRIQPNIPAPTDIEKKNFLDALSRVNPNIVGLSLFADFQAPFVVKDKTNIEVAKLPKALRNLYQPHFLSLDKELLHAQCQKAFSSLAVSENEATYLEEVTRNQSANIVWHEQRAGRITGSVAHSVIHANLSNVAKSTILKITMPTYAKNANVPSLLWGKEKEDEALTDYQNISSNPDHMCQSLCLNSMYIHKDLDVKNIGLVIKPDKPHLGVSPDAVVHCSCCGYGVVEIKCPYTLREKGLMGGNKNNFYLKHENNEFVLDQSHEYYSQIQHEMYVCDVKYCDFVVWTPIDFVVLRVHKNTKFINDAIDKYDFFWKEIILPELLTRSLESSQEPSLKKKNEKYCICDPPKTGDMVGCDKCDKWFHIQCLKLKKLPASKTWYCKDCRKTKK